MAFAGDALFPMGCGRVFTGDFVRMQASPTDGAFPFFVEEVSL